MRLRGGDAPIRGSHRVFGLTLRTVLDTVLSWQLATKRRRCERLEKGISKYFVISQLIQNLHWFRNHVYSVPSKQSWTNLHKPLHHNHQPQLQPPRFHVATNLPHGTTQDATLPRLATLVSCHELYRFASGISHREIHKLNKYLELLVRTRDTSAL